MEEQLAVETSRSREEVLQQIVTTLYQEERAVVIPLHPWILIRVLPKETETSAGIVLPDKQNKPVWEGIVLATYRQRYGQADGGETVLLCPQVEVGDHVLFPHYEGMPAPPLDEKKYRLIKEETIHAVLEYGMMVSVSGRLYDLVCRAHLIPSQTVESILNQFDVVPKDVHALTQSGV